MAILNIGRHAPWRGLRTTFRRRPARGRILGARMAADQTTRSGKDTIMFKQGILERLSAGSKIRDNPVTYGRRIHRWQVNVS